MSCKYDDIFKGINVKMPVDITLKGKAHRGSVQNLVYRMCCDVYYTPTELHFYQMINGVRVGTFFTGDMTKWQVVIE